MDTKSINSQSSFSSQPQQQIKLKKLNHTPIDIHITAALPTAIKMSGRGDKLFPVLSLPPFSKQNSKYPTSWSEFNKDDICKWRKVWIGHTFRNTNWKEFDIYEMLCFYQSLLYFNEYLDDYFHSKNPLVVDFLKQLAILKNKHKLGIIKLSTKTSYETLAEIVAYTTYNMKFWELYRREHKILVDNNNEIKSVSKKYEERMSELRTNSHENRRQLVNNYHKLCRENKDLRNQNQLLSLTSNNTNDGTLKLEKLKVSQQLNDMTRKYNEQVQQRAQEKQTEKYKWDNLITERQGFFDENEKLKGSILVLRKNLAMQANEIKQYQKLQQQQVQPMKQITLVQPTYRPPPKLVSKYSDGMIFNDKILTSPESQQIQEIRKEFGQTKGNDFGGNFMDEINYQTIVDEDGKQILPETSPIKEMSQFYQPGQRQYQENVNYSQQDYRQIENTKNSYVQERKSNYQDTFQQYGNLDTKFSNTNQFSTPNQNNRQFDQGNNQNLRDMNSNQEYNRKHQYDLGNKNNTNDFGQNFTNNEPWTQNTSQNP